MFIKCVGIAILRFIKCEYFGLARFIKCDIMSVGQAEQGTK